MFTDTISSRAARFAAVVVVGLLGSSAVVGEGQGCQGVGDYSYVCGPVSAEDLVRIPDTDWIVASGFGGGASLYLVDSKNKTWSDFYPGDEPRSRQDLETYAACPGSPDPNNFIAHGLHIRRGADGHSTLYVVGHGEREAIEIFDVDAAGELPTLTWRGCVMIPDGMEANSVASFPDGSLVATVPLHTGFAINEALAGRPTGAVHSWTPGADAFVQIEGTEMPYANGIETSPDGREFYVASSGLRQVLAFSNSNPARLLRRSSTFSIIPDNLHMGRGGKLLTAGMAVADSVCGDVALSLEFDLEKIAACPRPFTVLAIHPRSMRATAIASSPAQPNFSNVTMALELDDELWIGTFAGDRIAYLRLERDSRRK